MLKKTNVKNEPHHTKMLFERQEMKYFIPLQLIDLIMAKLDAHMNRDEYSCNGYYHVYSVYFDTCDWQIFHSKMDGIIYRKKLRVRTYNPDPAPDEPVFAEIKEKNDTVITKRRVALTAENINNLTLGRPSPQSSNVYDEWRYLTLKNSLRPKLLNSYARLAYQSTAIDELRVTLDRSVSYRVVDSIDFNQHTVPLTWSRNYGVMEVKFLRLLPAFLINIIKDHNLTRAAISKYSDSVISNFLLM